MDKGEAFDILLKAAVAALIVSAVIVFGIRINERMTELDEAAKETTTEIKMIYSLETQGTVSGSYFGTFVLGCGSINTEEYYYCYVIQDDGGKKYYKAEKDITTIYDTLEKDKQPYMEIIRNGLGDVQEYRIHVPENTIIQKYDANISQ